MCSLAILPDTARRHSGAEDWGNCQLSLALEVIVGMTGWSWLQAEVGLPAVVEVETETLDEVGETVTVPVILLNKEEVVDESAAPDDQLPLIFTGLTADNRCG